MNEEIIHIDDDLSDEELAALLPKETLEELSNGKGDDE